MKGSILKKITLGVAALLVALGMVVSFVPTRAMADSRDDVCTGIGLLSVDGKCLESGTKITVGSVIKTAINILSYVVGVAAVIMIIIGGLKYITSNGDSNSINSAKNTIIYALVGVVIVVLAQVIVRFVLFKINGSQPTPVTPLPL